MQTTDIICLKSTAYYALLDEILEHISTKFSVPQKQWLLTDEAWTYKLPTNLVILQNEASPMEVDKTLPCHGAEGCPN